MVIHNLNIVSTMHMLYQAETAELKSGTCIITIYSMPVSPTSFFSKNIYLFFCIVSLTLMKSAISVDPSPAPDIIVIIVDRCLLNKLPV